VIFTFINPLNNAFPWVTDHSAISTDQFGGSLNTTILSAYDIAGNFLGSVSVVKTGPSMTLELQGLGKIHKAKGGSTLAIQRNRRLHMKPGTYRQASIFVGPPLVISTAGARQGVHHVSFLESGIPR
jgi:hypothetical protein